MIPIKHAARFLNGAAFKPSDWGDSGLPILRIAQLTGKPFDNYFDGTINRGLLICDGDLLFSWSATIDAFIWDRGDAILNQHIFKVLPKKNATKKYLYYVIKAHAPRWADDDAHGSTMRHIKKESLSNKVWIPDLDTQESITAFLDHETARINQLIEKRARFAELLLERRLAEVSQAVTGHAGDGPWLETIPDGWKSERAKVHFRESQRRSVSGEEELLTVSHITGVTKRSEKDVNMFMAESNEGYKLVAPNDLIINTMWAWMGAMGVSSEHGLISPSYGVYSPVSEALRPAFVDLMVRSKPFIAEATRRSKGIHSSRLRLYPDAFLDMRLPIPPLEQQDEILSEISARTQREDELLQKNACAEALLREFRSALITAAVTGQIDVETWGKEGKTDRRLDQIEEDLALREARA